MGRLHALDDERNTVEREIQCAKDAGRRLAEQQDNQREECLALKQYIETLDSQNDDLQREMAEFIRADDLMKESLQRVTRAQELQARSEKEIRDSASVVRSYRGDLY